MELNNSVNKLFTWNVLSDRFFKTIDFYQIKEWTGNNKRIDVLKIKLSEQMKNNKILCLQEISQNMADNLCLLFIKHNYTYFHRGYNNQLGILLAFPKIKYDLVRVKFINIMNRKWLPVNDEHSKQYKSYRRCSERDDHILMVDLKCKTTKKQLCVCTVHLPCFFKQQDLMTYFAGVTINLFQKFSGNLPWIIAGDFNVSKGQETYDYLLTGTKPTNFGENFYHGVKNVELPSIKPMKSLHTSLKPFLTTKHKTYFKGNEEYFESMIDYIFHSKTFAKIKLTKPNLSNVEYLPKYPNYISDHEPMNCEFQL